MPSLIAGGKKHILYNFTGLVTGMGKDSLLYTFEGRTKDRDLISNTAFNRITIETSVQAFHHLSLKSLNGEERTLQLSDFVMACREGHELTAIWAVPRGAERGPLIVIVNNSTAQTFFSTAALSRMFRPPLLFHLLFIPAIILVIFFILGSLTNTILLILPAALVSALVGYLIGETGMKRFTATFPRPLQKINRGPRKINDG